MKTNKTYIIGVPSVFYSPTFGQMDFAEVFERLTKYIYGNKNNLYKIIIGTDSELSDQHNADFVTAVIIHRVGFGGIYFWTRVSCGNMYSLRQRMWDEANYSLMLAQKLIEDFKTNMFLV